MTDWKPGDLCQVRRGKRWVDAEIVAPADPMNDPLHGLRVSVDGRLKWVSGKDLRHRPGKRGKLPEPDHVKAGRSWAADANMPEPVLVGGFAGHAPGRPTTLVVSRVDHVRREIDVRPVPKPTTARSKDYLAHVRTFHCCSCGATEAIHAHHVASGGMGAKASDYLAAPLCGVCHQHWHATATLPLGDVNSGMRRLRSAAVLWEAAARCLEEWITREGE